MRILVAESDAAVLQSLIESLEHAGLTCDAAADGREALVRIGEQRYDLLLVDIGLARVDSADVLQGIARLRWNPPPAVIAIAMHEDVRSLDPDVVQIVLRRPLNVGQVVDLVQSCLAAVTRKKESISREVPEPPHPDAPRRQA